MAREEAPPGVVANNESRHGSGDAAMALSEARFRAVPSEEGPWKTPPAPWLLVFVWVVAEARTLPPEVRREAAADRAGVLGPGWGWGGGGEGEGGERSWWT